MPVRMRPRFEVVTPCPAQAAAGRLRAALDQPDAPCRGDVFGAHAVLYVPRAEERVWSPFLSLDLEGHREGTLVRGLFGPTPSVWSFFVAAYAVCGIVVLAGLGLAYAQASIGQAPWGLALVPAAALGALATYGVARYGQHRGRAQMALLRGFLDEALGSEPPGG